MENYKSLKDHVYTYISDKIKNKELAAGKKISEHSICETLNVSRTPVREALIALSSDGYLDQIPRRGFVVKHVSLERVNNIYAIIGALEALAASECLVNNPVFNTAPMEKIAVQMDKAIEKHDFEQYYDLQHRFHNIFVGASGNLELIRILDNLKKTLIKRSYNPNGDENKYKEALKKTNEEHWEIISLFQKRESEALQKYIKDIHWNYKYSSMEILT